METKKAVTTVSLTTASLFGAAMTSMLVAPELQAAVVNLTFTPSTNPFTPAGSLFPITIDQLGTNFSQWNDSFGRTMVAAGLGGVSVVSVSQVLLPSTFFPAGSISFFGVSSGTTYVGFRLGNNVGWFSFSVSGPGTDIHYLSGLYGDAGESVPVPAPGALALLALGALGVRCNRKRAP